MKEENLCEACVAGADYPAPIFCKLCDKTTPQEQSDRIQQLEAELKRKDETLMEINKIAICCGIDVGDTRHYYPYNLIAEIADKVREALNGKP